ncbi:hypothetical protein, partial [Klebsiella pneumoniae]
CRVTFSGQSHQLKTGKRKKARLPVGFFCACRSAVVPFFLLHLRDFSFIFFVASNTACRVGQQLDALPAFSLLNIFQ